MARTQIQSVTPGGPAHQAGVRPGETLVAINGHPIVDVLDYKYYSCLLYTSPSPRDA